MSQEDEKNLVSFLRSTAEVQIIESFAPTKEALWVDDFNPSFTGHHTYKIWNKNFNWTPEFGRVGSNAYDKSHIGWYYVANT